MVFKIPVRNMSKEEAEKVLKQMIANYQLPYGTFNGNFKIKRDPWWKRLYNTIYS